LAGGLTANFTDQIQQRNRTRFSGRFIIRFTRFWLRPAWIVWGWFVNSFFRRIVSPLVFFVSHYLRLFRKLLHVNDEIIDRH
jgi:hypothetical protein